MALKFIDDPDFNPQGKKVIVRFDFNVPLDKDDPSKITDTSRVDTALPTIEYILAQKPSKLILMSHLGRPKGKRVDGLSLEPVAKYLAQKLNQEVILTETAIDRGIKTLLGLNTTKIVLLQNLRFHPEEKKNDLEFSKQLASYGDLYVNDAFGVAHRKHASNYGINAYFKNKAFGGFLIKSEIISLDKIVESPQKPFLALLGGSKVSDKIKVIEKLLVTVDHLLIGGAMAYPFLKAQGHEVGKSLCSDEDIRLAKNILGTKAAHKISLPVDHLVSSNFKGPAEICDHADIPREKMGLDIGAKTVIKFKAKIKDAKTILWNGPMGLFEEDAFSNGSTEMGKALTNSDAFTLVGGGDSVAAIKKAHLEEQISHVSTGGGASLEYLENGTLPAIQALKFGVDL
jgi:phosphoglycerate kinase